MSVTDKAHKPEVTGRVDQKCSIYSTEELIFFPHY